MPTKKLDLPICPGILEDINKPTPDNKDALGPPPDWPGKVWVIEVNNGTHGVLVHHPHIKTPIHGLASCKSQAVAQRIVGMIRTQVALAPKFVEKTFDEAADLAASKGEPVTALFLVERLGDPKIFYVR